jgi:hypothetical protein
MSCPAARRRTPAAAHQQAPPGARAERDLKPEIDLPFAREHHGRGVLGGVADDGDDDEAEEHARQPSVCGLGRRVHQQLGLDRHPDRGQRQNQHRLARRSNGPSIGCASPPNRQRWVRSVKSSEQA